MAGQSMDKSRMLTKGLRSFDAAPTLASWRHITKRVSSVPAVELPIRSRGATVPSRSGRIAVTRQRLSAAERRRLRATERLEREEALRQESEALGRVAASYCFLKDAEARFQQAVLDAQDAGASYADISQRTGNEIPRSTLQGRASDWRRMRAKDNGMSSG